MECQNPDSVCPSDMGPLSPSMLSEARQDQRAVPTSTKICPPRRQKSRSKCGILQVAQRDKPFPQIVLQWTDEDIEQETLQSYCGAQGSLKFGGHGRKPHEKNASFPHPHVVVDWSARSKPKSQTEEQGRDLVGHVLRIAGRSIEVEDPEYAQTRHEALDRLGRLIVAGELDAGRRVLVGFDFPFGYPAGVAAAPDR